MPEDFVIPRCASPSQLDTDTSSSVTVSQSGSSSTRSFSVIHRQSAYSSASDISVYGRPPSAYERGSSMHSSIHLQPDFGQRDDHYELIVPFTVIEGTDHIRIAVNDITAATLRLEELDQTATLYTQAMDRARVYALSGEARDRALCATSMRKLNKKVKNFPNNTLFFGVTLEDFFPEVERDRACGLAMGMLHAEFSRQTMADELQAIASLLKHFQDSAWPAISCFRKQKARLLEEAEAAVVRLTRGLPPAEYGCCDPSTLEPCSS